MMRRRRPLMRAAMIGGGAYAVGKSRQRGQEREADTEQRLTNLEQQPAQPAPAAAPPRPRIRATWSRSSRSSRSSRTGRADPG